LCPFEEAIYSCKSIAKIQQQPNGKRTNERHKKKRKKNWFAQVNYEITQVLIEFYTRAEFTNGNQAEQSKESARAESGEWSVAL